MEELREKIASIIFEIDMKHGDDEFIDAVQAADRILAIPEIAEVLERIRARNEEGRWPDNPWPGPAIKVRPD